MHNKTPKELLEQIDQRLNYIVTEMKLNQSRSGDTIIDNQEFMQLLKISPRTAQNYRDSGLITYHKSSGKIYYYLKDVHEMLQRHTCKAFK